MRFPFNCHDDVTPRINTNKTATVDATTFQRLTTWSTAREKQTPFWSFKNSDANQIERLDVLCTIINKCHCKSAQSNYCRILYCKRKNFLVSHWFFLCLFFLFHISYTSVKHTIKVGMQQRSKLCWLFVASNQNFHSGNKRQLLLFLFSHMCICVLVIMMFSFRCTFRFPSTNIRLSFQSLVDETTDPPPRVRDISPPVVRGRDRAGAGGGAAAGPAAGHPLPPLRINIPPEGDAYGNSPFPSPTGTISAANSCPASPRGKNCY